MAVNLLTETRVATVVRGGGPHGRTTLTFRSSARRLLTATTRAPHRVRVVCTRCTTTGRRRIRQMSARLKRVETFVHGQ